jgi:murein DD-endopeptidase MepM/ murein hydrolase activator NlpD
MLRPPPRKRGCASHAGRWQRSLIVPLALLGFATGLASSVAADKSRTAAHGKNVAMQAAARELAQASERARRLGLGTLKAAGKLLAGRVEPTWLRATGPDKWLGALRMPVAQGHVSRGFGTGKGGYHQAVDIVGEPGSTIRTAAPGIVGYADDEVSGYGNFVIIIHAGGFITTYAHNQKLLVVAGQRVKRSQPIAQLGSTGRSKGPHLHTELLWNGLNCDPMPLFRPQARHKNGEPAVERLGLWKEPHKKPKSIRCAARKHHPDYVKELPVHDDDDEPSR